MRLCSLFCAVVVTALPAAAQPAQITCNAATCTFTLSFDDGYAHLANITGAPYSGEAQNGNSRTLPDGTHMSNRSSGPTIYRDPKGRVRTERPAYTAAPPDRPARPDDFLIAEIHDPVAGFEYVLDPVNRVAHRRPFKPELSSQWNPAAITAKSTLPSSDGPFGKLQFLGTRTLSGVVAYGQKSTSTRTTPDGVVISSAQETWEDPASGAQLLNINTTNGNEMTRTLANYSNAEPAASLFQVPEGYRTVDETGSFQVVHPHVGPGSSGTGLHGPELTSSSCDEVCTFTFDPGNEPANTAVTGAPYSGSETATSVSNSPNAATRRSTSRDSFGRLRVDPAPVSRGGAMHMPTLVEIQDPVAGYIYILNPTSQTAYRIKASFRSFPFQPRIMQAAGTRTAPNGRTDVVENLGPQTISAVTATGQRNTTTYPPGTYNQNDREIVTVNERWIDPKTGVVILTKNTGLMANMTTSMPDYKEGDPDASLFRIPAGYKIVDETGPFTFAVPAQ